MPGYTGQHCTILCEYPAYGSRCQSLCECDKDLCDATSGCRTEKLSKSIYCHSTTYKMC